MILQAFSFYLIIFMMLLPSEYSEKKLMIPCPKMILKIVTHETYQHQQTVVSAVPQPQLIVLSLTKPLSISRLIRHSKNLFASVDCFVTHETAQHQLTDMSLRKPICISYLFVTRNTIQHQPTDLSLTKPSCVSEISVG